MFTWPVNVCGVPTSFVAVNGEIWMFASTHVFTAFALSPTFAPPVARCNVKPPTTGSVDAFNTVTPAVADVRRSEDRRVGKNGGQLAALRFPEPLTFEKLIVVPAGAFT